MTPIPLKTDETWTLACRLAGMADERVRTIRIDEKLREAHLAGIRQGRDEAVRRAAELLRARGSYGDESVADQIDGLFSFVPEEKTHAS